MAIGKVSYSQLRNRNAESPQPLTSNSPNRSSATQKAYNLYINDTKTKETFEQYVGTHNPIHDSLITADSDFDESDHAYEFINKFKVCEIAVTSAAGSIAPNLDNSLWGQWRTKNNSGISVSPNVFLFPDEKNFEFSYENEVGSAWEKLSSAGLLSKVSQAAEAARSIAALAGAKNVSAAGKMMSRYVKAPTWTSSSPLKLGSSIKFTFQFGQGGIFSGEEEVVRPILALASLWAPLGSGYVHGILPTPPHYLITLLSGAIATGANIGATIAEGASQLGSDFKKEGLGGAAAGIVSNLTKIEEDLIKAQETAIVTTLAGHSRALCVRMGRMTFGPMIVKSCNWNFDFTQVDEYGFPYKGSITFGSLEGITLATPGTFTQMFDNLNGVGESKSNV